jgi:hypothetical protein
VRFALGRRGRNGGELFLSLASLMSKSLRDLSFSDVNELCQERAAEGQYIDFKRNLSGRGETGSDWNDGSEAINPRAVNELARALVAFANAEGGWLVLGIEEAAGRPARAEKITPLRACHDLARRLQQSLSERIDPFPLGLQIAGIETAAEGHGVVIMRMSASPYAPHGVRSDQGGGWQCYARRNDECRPMTMRDIQERTLEVNRGMSAVEAIFERRREAFRDRRVPLGVGNVLNDMKSIGWRITAVPLRDRFALEKVYRQNWLDGCRRSRFLVHPEGARYELYSALSGLGQFRPALRGTTSTHTRPGHLKELLITSTGVVSFEVKDAERVERIYLSWIGADTMNVLQIVNTIRSAAGNAEAEYGIDAEIVRMNELGEPAPFAVVPLGAQGDFSDSAALSPLRVPIWRVTDASAFGSIAVGIMADVCNAVGWQDLDGFSFEADQ